MSCATLTPVAPLGDNRGMKRIILLPALLVLFVGAALAQHEQPAKRKATLADAMRELHTIAVKSDTGFIKDDMVIEELQKHKELEQWSITVTTGDADALLEVDHTPMTFIYTYKFTHRTGTVLAAGKLHAISGPVAAEDIADKVVEHIAKYRKEEKPNDTKGKEPVTPKP